jgi:2-oxoglutarate ferredoxin oxidoreductase subunit alpha
VVTASEMLARAAASVGYHVKTFVTFPSQIMGGPTWSQARISTTPVLSSGDELDVLVALNRYAFDTHVEELRKGGVALHDPSFEPPATFEGRAIPVPIDELAKKTGESRSANMVIIGALAYLVDMSLEYFRAFVSERFKGRDAVIQANHMALSLGYEYAANSRIPHVGELEPPVKPTYEQLFLKGNDALCLGALKAGVESFVGYPISPATPILVFMERNLVGPGQFAYQGSSEIEAINAIIGASYAGKKAMTATSGPGFSLMSEGIGMAWMTEIPIVVVDVQRGGPATGLPTKTEQSDFQAALHPAHGDSKLPIIAVGSVEECFYAAVTAFNWAERYQGPVVLLSEHSLAEAAQNIRKPDLSKVVVETRKVYRGQNGYHRYDGFELSPMPLPGSPGSYIANASEHDPVGDTTHLPQRHIQMTKRRFSKLELLRDGTYERERTNEPLAVMTWGGSKGPAREAYEYIANGNGLSLGWYYTMHLHPLPPRLVDELRQKELVLVPELNYQGQFASYLRTYGIRAEAITQYTGLPFKVRDLAKELSAAVEAKRRVKVSV